MKTILKEIIAIIIPKTIIIIFAIIFFGCMQKAAAYTTPYGESDFSDSASTAAEESAADDTAASDTAASDTAASDKTASDTDTSDTAASDADTSDTAASDTDTSDSAASDADTSDTDTSDSAASDTDDSDSVPYRQAIGYKENIILEEDRFNSFEDAIEKLEFKYGFFRIRSVAYPGNEVNPPAETNGVCYLSLTDFNNDGIDDLFAVCKSEEEFAYTGYLFMKDGEEVKCVFRSDSITYKSDDGLAEELRIIRDPHAGCLLMAGHSDEEDFYTYVYGFDEGEMRLIESDCVIYSEEDTFYGRPLVVVDNEIVEEKQESDNAWEQQYGLQYGQQDTMKDDQEYGQQDGQQDEQTSPEEIIDVYLRTEGAPSDLICEILTKLEDSVKNVKRELQIEDKKSVFFDHGFILPKGADYSLYKPAVENLEEKYGSLRIKEGPDPNNIRKTVVNGLCYLNLMDLNNNNIKEMIAVCKNDFEHTYHLYVYSIERGQPSCLLDINDPIFADNGSGTSFEDSDVTFSVWITKDPEGNAAVIAGDINRKSSYYEIYGYGGFNYQLLHKLFSRGTDEEEIWVDSEKCSRWKYDTIMGEWSLRKKPDTLSDSWTPTETSFCLIDINCQRIDIDFLADMIERTKKDIAGPEAD